MSVEAMKVNTSLKELDPEVYNIIENEKGMQQRGVNLIDSENVTSQAVMEAVGSVMVNKYLEGYPGSRYYCGNEFIDHSESLCRERALQAYRSDPKDWGVDVQPLSGSPVNFQVLTALCVVHDRIMGLDLRIGGRLSHGFQADNKKISMVSKVSFPYRLDEETGLIDYDECEKFAMCVRPNILITGTSAYSHLIDHERMRTITDACGAILLVDMARISGLVAGGVIPTPFQYAGVVTTTTHKSLHGPRAAMIFYRKGPNGTDTQGNPIMFGFEERINAAVFPGLQGGPPDQSITALAVALKAGPSPEFKEYQGQVLNNAQALGQSLSEKKFDLVSEGTSNHLLLDLRYQRASGHKSDHICENTSIILNKNIIPGVKSAMVLNGLRVGAHVMTTRGLVEEYFARVGECLIVFIVFAVAGIFLQSALEQAALVQDYMIAQQLKNKNNFMAKLMLLYHDLDTSRVGAITNTDFEEQMGSEKCARNTPTACIQSPSIYPRFVGIRTVAASTRASCLIQR
jgi:glycine hydroxymethyltransferase